MAKKKAKTTVDAPISLHTGKSEEDWEAKHSFDTLLRAAEITSNRSLMKRVKAHARSHEERAKRVARLEGKLL